MLNEVKARLLALQIPFDNSPNSNDEQIITFSVEKVIFYVQSRTNLKEVPETLNKVAIDMVVGDFLSTKHSMGQLDLSTLNFEAITKQVQDGDTTVTFAVKDDYSPEAMFYSIVERMRKSDVKWSDYRVIKW